ncbi:MAG: thioredoxin domain-containing protein, partial [Planctomycetes bacterium]|nr:thioredoxin domain-containing protein [Planctomycetota bacterium]
MISHVIQCRWFAAGLLWIAVCGCSAHESESSVVGSDNSAVASDQPAAATSKQRHTNRLSRESSPYLLLHAHNPVDWYPWGPEAFEKAKKENKPIFLSIGYSSCFWCHVMERKVFTNEIIAAYMNQHFVNIKVDREERPDVDDIYMTSLTVYFQAIGSSQGGGWPLSMFLTPEGKPFAGGTYFPPEDENGRPGFVSVIKRVNEVWTKNRKQTEEIANVLTREVQRVMKPRLVLTSVKIERKLVSDVTQALMESYDPVHGGIDFNPNAPTRPKFPVPSKLALLQYAIRNGDKEAEKIVIHTLDSIAAGGIHDHLGGGFHRYSTDRRWHVPHFEKMLYDQAQLADVYIEAFRQTGNVSYRKTAEGIFTFLFREMIDPLGGFHSALDAETDGVEGEYYAWSKDEVAKTLGRDESELFRKVYGMEQPQGFEHGYVLHLPKPLDEVAEELKLSTAELERRLIKLRSKLLSVRQQRKPLLKDDKILASWNGLMIRALANAGRVLENEKYVQAAEQVAEFILSKMRDEQGRLHRTFRGKQAGLNAYLDDYAFLVEGLLALHQATGIEKWLNAAQRLTDQQIDLFWDEKRKAFFFTSHHHEELIARTKNAYDSVLPSGNSVSVRNLIRLSKLTGLMKYRQYAQETLDVFAGTLKQAPGSMSNMALAIGEFLDAAESQENEQPNPDPNPDSTKNNESGAARESRSGLQSVVCQVPVESSAEQSKTKKKKEELVTLRAYLSVDKLLPGSTCKVVVLLTVKKGWHINANPPKPKFLKPTTFTVSSKQGVKLTSIRYPKGNTFEVTGFDEALKVYEGNVAIYGILTLPSDLTA